MHLCMPVYECMQLHSNETDVTQYTSSTHKCMYWSTLEVEGGVKKRFGSQRVTWKVRRRG